MWSLIVAMSVIRGSTISCGIH